MQVRTHAQTSPYLVPHHIAVLSILLFWLFYYVTVSFRSWIMGYPGYALMLDNRAWVSLFGVGLTYLLYWALRLLNDRPLRLRVAAAFVLSAVVATAYSAVNYASFYVYDPVPPEIEQAKRKAGKIEEPEKKDAAHLISENALHWYFFIVSWSVFYLAMSYAGAVGASEREASRLRAAAQTAELRALRYQVNPHFLFNTLNSISSLVMSGKREDAEAMILNLAAFFRTSLAAEPTEDVPLSEEIAVQQLYLAIETVRFPERLHAVFDIDPGLQDACVPGLILQPLIENAVKYGVAPAHRAVQIAVTARLVGGMLEVAVADDGDGPANAAPSSLCVGLRNVRDRLAARFGDVATLTAGKRDAGGFAATITIPLVRDGC